MKVKYMTKKYIFLYITIAVVILTFLAVAYQDNSRYLQRGEWELKKTGTLAALEVKNLLSGSEEKPFNVPILMYHSINDQPIGVADLSVRVKDFEAQMKYLADNGYTVIGFDQLKNGGQYEKPIILTFDDGYEDNYTNAYPVLKKYHLKATFFIISDAINSPGYLTEEEIHEMSGLVSFQSHTVDHPHLSELGEADTEKEFSASKEAIEKITNKKVDVVAYPYGDYNKLTTETAAKYYDYAVTTEFGYYFSGSEKYSIKRLDVSRFEDMDEFMFYIR